ncbi:MAG: hypothetical protein KF773_41600 [Deltaproteobacteria bacterium]|nr:hypothetical protein [Deltaproteobacteria bacterium]
MRSLVVAVLLAGCSIAAAGCGKGGAAAEVSTSEPAGRVVEVTGKVEATRGGATRALSAGAEVFRDDVIAATGDGAVAIDLFHNGARWHVGGGQPKKRLDESVAWGLAKAAPGESVAHATSAAGRNGERTAADTAATAASKDTADHDGKKVSAKNPTDNLDDGKHLEKTAKDPTDGLGGKGGGAGGGPGGEGGSREERKNGGDESGNQGASPPERDRRPDPVTTPPRNDPPKRVVDDLPPKTGQTKNLELRGGGNAEVARKPAIEAPASEKGLAGLREPLRACLDAATPKLTLVVTVTGGARSIAAAGAPPAVLACIQRVLARVPPGADGRASLELAK